MYGKTHLVVIQATPFCNIDCRYCYLPDRRSNKRLQPETLAQILATLERSQCLDQRVTFLWHAGEPLVVGVPFYTDAFRMIADFGARTGIKVRHTFQTNATLLDAEWCALIAAHKVNVGVSIDGPQHLHDQQRVDRAGRGTFERVLRGMRLLQTHNISFYTIMVVTAQALDQVDAIWQFFMEQGVKRLAFNVEEVEGVHKQSSLQTAQAVTRYQAFLRRLIELRALAPMPVWVRELDAPLNRVQRGRGVTQSTLNQPLKVVSFDWAGNISTFSPELLGMRHPRYDHFIFGNVASGAPLEAILADARFQRINAEIQRGIARCAAGCDYYRVCGGGTPSNKLAEHDTFDATETMHCRLRVKATTDIMLDHLERRLDLVEAQPELV